MNVLIVGIGGFLGSIARYGVNLWVRAYSPMPFPLATLLVNVCGSFLIGFLMLCVERAIPFHRQILLLGVTGFLGGMTTFSAFTFETVSLFRSDQVILAGINVSANLILGLAAVVLGRGLAGIWV